MAGYNEELKPETVKLDNIFLDPNNPRFAIEGKRPTPEKRIPETKVQQAALERMRKYDIESLKDNIKEVGFLKIDRVIVRPFAFEDGKFVVVEGNRRIAALKDLYEEYNGGEIELRPDVLGSIEEIKTLVYEGEEKDAAWIFQGLRHISGIRDWPPYQQAYLLVRKMDEEKPDLEIADKLVIAGRKLGIRSDRAARLFRSYRAYQAMAEEYGPRTEPDKFSIFLEAVFAPTPGGPIRTWLEWDDDKFQFQNKENLKKFYSWVLPDENGRVRIRRAIDLRDDFSVIKRYPEIFQDFEEGRREWEDAYSEAVGRRAIPAGAREYLDNIKRLDGIIRSFPGVAGIEIRKEAVEILKKVIDDAKTLIRQLSV